MSRSTLVFLALLTLSACTCGATKLKQVEVVDAGSCQERGDCPCVPTAEVCNGVDDDCDGLVDEDQPRESCGVGACRRELSTCANGQIQTCVPGTPTPEVCNGLDDDCNGAVDEGLLPQQCGQGQCAVVQASCAAGMPLTCTAGMPTAETCNGLDDNCDGTVDEGLVENTSGDLRLTTDPAASDFVYVAASTTGFGAVWQDKRDGAGQKGEIYFAGLDKQGHRASAQDTRLTTTTGLTTHPALAWSGSAWGLAYADDTVGNLELYFRPLQPNGGPTAPAVRLTNAALDSDWPDIVWTGTGFAIVWEDERAGANKQDLYFQLVDAAGQKVGAEVQVTTDPARQSSPILKWNGTEFGLAWTDYRNAGTTNNREVYFRRLSATGAPLGGEVRITDDPADSAWADLAWNDVAHEWALVWHDTRDGNDEVYFARVSAAGQKLGGDVRLTNAPGFSGYPSIDWNGYQYGVSWQDDRLVANKPAIYFAPVSAQGVKTGPDLKLSSGSGASTFTTALWNGSTFAFCWRDDRDGPTGNTEIYFSYVGCPGTH